MERPDEEFLQEARANLRGLTDGLLAVEGRHDAETVDELFRTAHSLKGTCSTVGLTDASQLAHSLEDVLAALRRGDVEATAELIDEALAAVDDLEAIIEASANGVEPSVDSAATGASLRDALDVHRAEATDSTESAPDDETAGEPPDESPPGIDDDALSDDVLAALEEASEFDDIDALIDEMDDPDDGASLDAWGMLSEEGAVDATGAAEDATVDVTDAAEDGPMDATNDAEDATVDVTDDVVPEPDSEATPDDPAAFFESVKADLDGEPTDVDDLQREIETVEFGEFDEDDDITIDELLELDPTGEPAEPGVTERDIDPGEIDVAESGDTDPAETADEATASFEPGDDPAIDAPTAAGPDDAESPDVPTDPEGISDEWTPSPSHAAAPAEAEPTVTDPETTETVAEASGTEESPTEEPAVEESPTEESEVEESPTEEPAVEESPTEEPAVEESPTEEPTVEEPPTTDPGVEEPGTGEPAHSIDRAVEEAERSGFEFGTIEPTDATTGDSPDDPTPASADAGVASGVDAASSPADEVPDPDTVPDVDLFGADEIIGAESSVGGEMEIELDEEMVAFESRFAGALDQSPTETETEDEVSDVFRAAVTTIEDSHLDEGQFGVTDSEDAEASLSGGLPPLTVTVETAEQLMNIAEELSFIRHDVEDALGEEVPDFQRLVTEYQRTVMNVRLMPLETAIEAIPRTVRDVMRAQDKEIDLVIEDTDVRLDRGVIDRLRDPLIHLARNAVDHGIEPPAERVAAGKPPEGRIELRTEQAGDEVVIELSDDGRGIDPERVRESAIERGRLSREAARELTDEETYDLLFEAGVSTAEEVTDVSGRGVGMDVVGDRVATLDGHVEVESDPGSGTTVRLVVPVSIALTEVVFVEIGDEQFGLPLTGVEGVTEIPDDLEHGGFVRLDDVSATLTPEGIDPGGDVPFVDLREALDVVTGNDSDRSRLVWVRDGTDLLAVGCDRIVGSREVIIRPYEDLLRAVPGVQGATTMSDGRPVNVIDVGTL